ncbi:response regulator transcription factor [Streptomyces sp. NPDC088246]|uniref:response regulator transcription factor n=1 Tax=Streptomyces sp. NPDC088246 TaxID=3365842 RepID=UPI00382E63BD
MSARILVAEDDVKQARLIGIYLEREGNEVQIVADGRSAIDRARSSRPDLIVLDVMMPNVDGLDVCRILRAESQVPILLLTARTTEEDMLLGLDLGADDYMAKPYSPRELTTRVRALLRRSKAAGRTEPAVLPAAAPSASVMPRPRYMGRLPYSGTTGRSSTRSTVSPRHTILSASGSQVTVPLALIWNGTSGPCPRRPSISVRSVSVPRATRTAWPPVPRPPAPSAPTPPPPSPMAPTTPTAATNRIPDAGMTGARLRRPTPRSSAPLSVTSAPTAVG